MYEVSEVRGKEGEEGQRGGGGRWGREWWREMVVEVKERDRRMWRRAS